VAAEGESLFDTDLSAPVAIAIGNEGAGLSAALRDAATRRVSIPMPGGFESAQCRGRRRGLPVRVRRRGLAKPI
jgi:hypothetical protein